MFKSVWKKGKKWGSVQGPFQFRLKEKEIKKKIKHSSRFGRKKKKGVKNIKCSSRFGRKKKKRGAGGEAFRVLHETGFDKRYCVRTTSWGMGNRPFEFLPPFCSMVTHKQMV